MPMSVTADPGDHHCRQRPETPACGPPGGCEKVPETGSLAPSSQPPQPAGPSKGKQPPKLLSLRPGWPGIAQVTAIAAIAAGAVAAIYAERTTIRQGVFALHHTQIGWVLAGFGAELMSMVALAQLERGLLRRAGARLTLRSVLATAYSTNVIAVTVPIIGSGIATAHAYRDFRRAGTAPELASMALTIAGVFSSVAFAVVTAAGALLTSNPAAAAAALAASVPLAAAVTVIMVALRFPRARDWLTGRLIGALRLSKRVTGRPRGEPRPLVTGALERVGALRLGYAAAGRAFGWALVNWIADVACLICAIKAAGEPVPWAAVLLIWSAGAGAASFSPVPAGLGIADIVLIAAFAAAGLHNGKAVAAVFLYRIISLKPLISAGWLGYHFLTGRRTARGLRAGKDPLR
jgi:putative heme transporter